jgi:ABC-type phosphate/phosphonate transport system substrate-binding protein
MKTMRAEKLAGILAMLAVAFALLDLGGIRAEDGSPAQPIKIGIASSVFRDTPPSLITLIPHPLRVLMETQTGVPGDLELAGDAFDLAKKLKENKVQLGVFHGFEFAWAKQQCPELKPLVISVAEHRLLHAHLIVRKEDPAVTCADLRGKIIALPAISRGHLHLYLECRCPAPGTDLKKFFAEVRRPADAEDALDEVFSRTAAAAIVERAALDQYQENKPARSLKLRVLHQSETFPPSVIAYCPGSLDESMLKRMREGLISADGSPKSRDLLKMCRISKFEEIPADYDHLLAEIARAYPAPVRAKEGK